MSWEDRIAPIVILSLFVVAAILLVWETRPIWAGKVLVYQGNLTAYSKSSGYHVFSFEDGTSKTLEGWMWKTQVHLYTYQVLYQKGPAIVLEETTEPVIA